MRMFPFFREEIKLNPMTVGFIITFLLFLNIIVLLWFLDVAPRTIYEKEIIAALLILIISELCVILHNILPKFKRKEYRLAKSIPLLNESNEDELLRELKIEASKKEEIIDVSILEQEDFLLDELGK